MQRAAGSAEPEAAPLCASRSLSLVLFQTSAALVLVEWPLSGPLRPPIHSQHNSSKSRQKQRSPINPADQTRRSWRGPERSPGQRGRGGEAVVIVIQSLWSQASPAASHRRHSGPFKCQEQAACFVQTERNGPIMTNVWMKC